MNVRYLSVLLMLAVLVVAGGILPASSAAQTVVGPEYALVKSPINSLQRANGNAIISCGPSWEEMSNASALVT